MSAFGVRSKATSMLVDCQRSKEECNMRVVQRHVIVQTW